MAAKGKAAAAKTSRKAAEPTPVKAILKAKKMPAKASKKPAKKITKKVIKKAAPAKPVITDAMLMDHLLALSDKKFIQFTKDWNEANLKVTLKPQENYDAWLNYFKTLPPNTIRLLAKTGLDILPTEAYAALARWHDIISNPGRIDKIHQAGLTNTRAKDAKNIVELAAKNDRLGVLQATRDKIAEKLEKGAGARDTAALARELTEVMTQIADYEKRLGPKKTTVLGQLLDEGLPGARVTSPAAKKRPGKNGGGTRNTSYAARVTIEDVEND